MFFKNSFTRFFGSSYCSCYLSGSGSRTPPPYQTKYGLCLSEVPNLPQEGEGDVFNEVKTNTMSNLNEKHKF